MTGSRWRSDHDYHAGMEQGTSAPESMAELLARTGVQTTAEGRERARLRLAESARRNADDADETAEFLARLRAGSAAA